MTNESNEYRDVDFEYEEQSEGTLLHKGVAERTSPFPGRIHPTASVMGMPRAV